MRMENFSLLVKPVGAACNLACEYCFYSNHPSGTMSRETLSRLLEGYTSLPLASHSIALQGGEPLLAPGYVFDMVEDAKLDSISVQTNATLITDAVAERFARNGYLAGVSLDGDERHSSARGASHCAATEGVRKLEKHGADYNILAVVSKRNVRDLAGVYRYLRDNFRTRHHQYIECTSSALAVSAAEWGAALISLFDEWSANGAGDISIRLFESLFSEILYGRALMCPFSSHCSHYFVVEFDGSVYPCDFYVDQEHLLGNVTTHSWEEIIANSRKSGFSAAKMEFPQKCLSCEYIGLCRGDCQRNRRSGGESVLCEGYKRFFAHFLSSDLVRRLTAGQEI